MLAAVALFQRFTAGRPTASAPAPSSTDSESASVSAPGRAPTSNSATHPSPELLQARERVARLHRELAAVRETIPQSRPAAAGTEDDLTRLMEGQRPSDAADFRPAEHLENRGFASAEEALETFFWSFSGEDRHLPFEDLWWQPSEPAGEGFHYEVDLGHGIGRLKGYRVTRRDEVGPDEVILHVEREERHAVIREEARLVRTDSGWKRMPAIRRVPNKP